MLSIEMNVVLLLKEKNNSNSLQHAVNDQINLIK